MERIEKLETEHKAWLKKNSNKNSKRGGKMSKHKLKKRLRSLLWAYPPGWEGSDIIYHDDGSRTLTHPTGAVAHIKTQNIIDTLEGSKR